LLTRLIALAFVLVLLACSRGGDALPGLGINIEETSVSGLSAGAYMAGQLQVAHSEQIVGAGIVAGGPFGCAESQANNLPSIANNLSQAFESCLNGRGIPNTAALIEQAKGLAAAGKIDPLTNLDRSRIYLFSGGKDQIVDRSVVEAAKRFYIDAGVPQENVALMTRDDAGHSILTNDTGNACGLSASPFVSDCDYDQSGAILQWIYGELNTPAERPKGRFLIFDQSPYAETGNGLSSEAVVYIPAACTGQNGCRLHIALHGCEQNRDQVGMTFIEDSGFARWADTNRLVILFPQVKASILNPKACWDWWGYTGKDFLTKGAPQIAAIWRMVEQLANGNKSVKAVFWKEDPAVLPTTDARPIEVRAACSMLHLHNAAPA
jgi:poly(3-hydroxybutyrate) depolymerase